MALSTKEVEIAGTRFRVSQLPATRSLKLLAKLGKVLGPSLAHLGKAVGKGGSLIDAQIDFGELGAALGAVFAELADDAAFDALQRDLLAGVVVLAETGVKPLFSGAGSATFDAVFAGHATDACKLWLAVLEVEYADFFGVIAGLKERALAAMVRPPAPAAESSGSET